MFESKTTWQGDTWRTATPGEIAEAREQWESCLAEFKGHLQWIPEAEIQSWDVYNDLKHWGLV